ncbi:MAG: DUF1566 domain-containing protein [Glaciecola sp.]|jgi:hypothetical protein
MSSSTRVSKIASLVSLMVLSSFTQAQEEQFCLSTAPMSASTEQFRAFESGQVLHLSTNLMWMRCALGQTWDGETCLGEANPYTWKEALDSSVSYEFNGSSNWRLPNIKELSSITERSCTRPSINEELFPNTRPDDFWTSTPSMTDPERAWVVAFFNSSNSIKEKNRAVFVRLVRTPTALEIETE